MKRELLFKENSFSIWRQKGIPPEAIEFLESIAWGSAGAVYEHMDTAEIVPHLQDPSIMYITEAD